jgi:glycosyltransferase involved in cell wall biosynthesis
MDRINKSMVSGQTISVIICTFNRAHLLDKCLGSLATQMTGALACDVIVVDSSSNDETRLLVAEYTERFPSIRYVFEGMPGHSNARNRGYHEAGGDYLIYLDDDAIPSPEYLVNVIREISDHSPDILGGPVYPYYTSPKPWWFRDEFEVRKYKDQSGFSKRCGISGGNFIIRKHLLGSLGLFDAEYGMSGGKLGMLDDRKVLEAYRATTPSEQQRVYYSLACFVNHYTPPEKMHLGYMVRRAYSAGTAQFWMRLDVDGHPNHIKGFQLILRGISKMFFLETVWKVIKFAIENIKFISPIILGLTFVAKGIGYNLAQFRYYSKGLFARD